MRVYSIQSVVKYNIWYIWCRLTRELPYLVHRGVVVNFYLPERSSCKSNLVHFRLKIMTSGGNNFNNFSENQLVKFRV